MRDRFKASMLAISLMLGGLVAFAPMTEANADQTVNCNADLSFEKASEVTDNTTLIGQSQGAATYPELGSLAVVQQGKNDWGWYYGVTHKLDSKKTGIQN